MKKKNGRRTDSFGNDLTPESTTPEEVYSENGFDWAEADAIRRGVGPREISLVLKSSKTTVGISAHALDVDVTASGESLQHAIDAVAEACVAKYKLLGRKLPTKAPEKFWNERDQIKRLVSFVEFGRKIIAGSDAKQTGVDGLQFQAALVTLMISGIEPEAKTDSWKTSWSIDQISLLPKLEEIHAVFNAALPKCREAEEAYGLHIGGVEAFEYFAVQTGSANFSRWSAIVDLEIHDLQTPDRFERKESIQENMLKTRTLHSIIGDEEKAAKVAKAKKLELEGRVRDGAELAPRRGSRGITKFT